MKAIRIITILLVIASVKSNAQDIQYGTNDKAGHYCNVGDAKIYYEVYGEGRPVVLLHGGYHGYIDEFKHYIPILSKKFKVIAIATRGYGKSEIGTKPFSRRLFAQDVKTVLKKESNDSAIFIGMSDGSIVSFLMALEYPEMTKKAVCIAGSVHTLSDTISVSTWAKNFNPEDFEKEEPDFVRERKKLMPEPERWLEFLGKMKITWNDPIVVSYEKLKGIKCSVLIIFGDRDDSNLMNVVDVYKNIPNAQLAIIPNASHGDLSPRTNTFILENYILPFVAK